MSSFTKDIQASLVISEHQRGRGQLGCRTGSVFPLCLGSAPRIHEAPLQYIPSNSPISLVSITRCPPRPLINPLRQRLGEEWGETRGWLAPRWNAVGEVRGSRPSLLRQPHSHAAARANTELKRVGFNFTSWRWRCHQGQFDPFVWVFATWSFLPRFRHFTTHETNNDKRTRICDLVTDTCSFFVVSSVCSKMASAEQRDCWARHGSPFGLFVDLRSVWHLALTRWDTHLPKGWGSS